ncbi:MAG TPA: hypothetical protein VJY62_02175 [Bacteroidia bacterium]|nr:hypothetical protein [Bacteroidia bacterium]
MKNTFDKIQKKIERDLKKVEQDLKLGNMITFYGAELGNVNEAEEWKMKSEIMSRKDLNIKKGSAKYAIRSMWELPQL